jgi:hypothetical protein
MVKAPCKVPLDAGTSSWPGLNYHCLGVWVGIGECYHGAGQVFFTEYYGNQLTNSDGITLKDNPDNHEWECTAYTGPWLRWAVVRRNRMAGISDAARNLSATAPPCGFVGHFSTQHPSSDVVVEHNVFECPAPGVLPSNTTSPGVVLGLCTDCLVR